MDTADDADAQLLRRSALQLRLGTSYDGLHALLARAVHPICFSAFALTVSAIGGGALWLLVEVGIDGEVAAFIVTTLFAALVAALKFVLTPFNAVAGLVVIAGWIAGLHLRGQFEERTLWILWSVAAISVLIQLALLLRCVPDRARNGLLHLLLPATLGTLAGAVPVVLGFRLLRADELAATQQLALTSFTAGAVVLLVLLAIHLYVRIRSTTLLELFAAEHDLRPGAPDALLIGKLVPAWAGPHRGFHGEWEGRHVAATTGFTHTAQADLPSMYVSIVAVRCVSGGTDVWVRRSAWDHDNVLASLGRSEVVAFESIRLDEGWNVRFAGHVDEQAAREIFGPVVVDLLATGLGDGQLCRIGDTVLVFRVGGAASARELANMLALGTAFAGHMERADAVRERLARRDAPPAGDPAAAAPSPAT